MYDFETSSSYKKYIFFKHSTYVIKHTESKFGVKVQYVSKYLFVNRPKHIHMCYCSSFFHCMDQSYHYYQIKLILILSKIFICMLQMKLPIPTFLLTGVVQELCVLIVSYVPCIYLFVTEKYIPAR